MPAHMDRRQFLTAAGSAGLTAAAACSSDARPASNRPNILWISAEDICPLLGCYGDPYATTPRLDAFAREGVVYTSAYAHAGVCAPARSGLITGVYPSSLGSHHMRSSATLPETVRCFPEYLREAGYYCSNRSKEDYNFPTPASAWDESSGKAHWRNRPKGAPFFSVFNFGVCHESVLHGPRKPVDDLPEDLKHDPADAPVPAYHPDVPAFREDWARYYDAVTALDGQVGRLLDELEEDGLAEDTIVLFWGDHGTGMPRGKRWIWRSGTHIPLIIRFPEKYRHLAPEPPGGRCDRLVNFVDFAPTMLSLAGVDIPDYMQGRAFLGAQAGEPRDCAFFTRDRMDERYDMIRGVTDGRFRYLRNYNPFLPYDQHLSYLYKAGSMQAWKRMARRDWLEGPPARYMRPRKPVEELYDMEADPDEVNNLAGASEHEDRLERMRGRLRSWILETRDLGFLGEAEMHARTQGRPEYAWARNSEAYDLPRIVETADLPLQGEGAADELASRLDDADSAVRYWAVLGLITLAGGDDGAALERRVDATARRLDDPSPSVRLAAAFAMGQAGRHDQALPALRSAVENDSAWVKLRAANILDGFGAERPGVKELLEALEAPDTWYVERVTQHALERP